MTQHRITDDLEVLLDVLPPNIRHAVEKANNSEKLLEIVIDLGRIAAARFVDGEVPLSVKEITRAEIDHITERIGTFDADNRAGMERTLHRISAIRNRLGTVVGLTCRVGRAVYGTVDIIQDIIESGKSVLILGRLAWAKPPCCVKPPASWRRRNASSLSTPPTRSAVTGTYLTPPLARRGACRYANPCSSTRS